MAEQGVPKNREAEMSVVGAALLEASSVMPELTRELDELGADAFYFRSHRKIYQILAEMFESGEPIDPITVGNRLEEKNVLPEVGGRAYLSELVSAVTTTTSIAYYAEIVRKKAFHRLLIDAAQQIAEIGYDDDQGLMEAFDKSEQALMSVTQQNAAPHTVTLQAALDERIEELEQVHHSTDEVLGVPSGYDDLDRVTLGFQPGGLYILAGRPSMGKSSLVLETARRPAHKGNRVLFFNGEMVYAELVDRFISQQGRLDNQRLRKGELGSDEFASMMNVVAQLHELPIVIDDTPGMSLPYIKATSRRVLAESGVDLILVDYLQLLHSGRRDLSAGYQEVTYMVRALKELARELQVPVICLSQLSRSLESREDKRPRLNDLRESGEIEQAADVVMFLYRDSYYNGNENLSDGEQDGETELIVAKQRNGPTGMVRLKFLPKFAGFEPFSAAAPPPEFMN